MNLTDEQVQSEARDARLDYDMRKLAKAGKPIAQAYQLENQRGIITAYGRPIHTPKTGY